VEQAVPSPRMRCNMGVTLGPLDLAAAVATIRCFTRTGRFGMAGRPLSVGKERDAKS
jgi:hypothetical protein